MSIKEKLLRTNIIATETMYHLLKAKQISRYFEKVNRFSKIDSIRDVEHFYEEIKIHKAQHNNMMYLLHSVYNEGTLYGHYDALTQYARLGKTDYLLGCPRIEHGINFTELALSEEHAYIFQGGYKNAGVRRRFPSPIYNVGPYIQYAPRYYDEETFTAMKKNLGKMLLVFPSHTHEMVDIHYDHKNFVEKIFDKHAASYDSIVFCLYWNDINDSILHMLHSLGGIVVCAGHRVDFSFISRLKEIILLSDHVIVNDIGTNIGYCLSLNRPVQLIDCQIDHTEKINDAYRANYQEFMNAFSTEESRTQIQPEQIELCDRFWGLTIRLTPEEMASIFRVSSKIARMCLGFSCGFQKSAYRLLGRLSKASVNDTDLKMLREALTAGRE